MTGVESREEPGEPTRVLCLVPPELSGRLLEPLRRHYADLDVEVLEERRSRERRSNRDRRRKDKGPPKGLDERRLIKNRDGRRVGERRATLVSTDPPAELPRKARPYADRIAFYERIPIPEEQEQDLDTARIVTRIQAGERDLFAALYERYFDGVYAYLRILFRDPHEAEDAAQQVFMKLLESLSDYERRRQPFRAWLFVIARNHALSQLKKRGRQVVTDPEDLNRHLDEAAQPGNELPALQWVSDPDLMLFIERLPVAQRQVLVLRYMMDLTDAQIGEILDRSREDVRALQYRALQFLRTRLAALGRGPKERRGRSRLVRCPNQAFVLRERRFSLVR